MRSASRRNCRQKRRQMWNARLWQFAHPVLIGLALLSIGCQKDSEAIVSIALHPTNSNILYVATNDAAYKTRDGGQTWEKFPSFSDRRVTTVAIDPQLPATVVAVTMVHVVYTCTDGGYHRLKHHVGLTEHVSFVNQFLSHPTLIERIYSATNMGTFYRSLSRRAWE